MKKEYLEIIKQANDLVKKVPKINNWGMTVNTSTYLKAYQDFSQSSTFLTLIIDSAFNAEIYEKISKRDDVDTEEQKEMMKIHIDNIYSNFEKLNEFIKERISKNWS